jgi:ABC-2 type transport system permease protein
LILAIARTALTGLRRDRASLVLSLRAVSTLLILIMSAVGGSMFARFLMPEAGLSINAWAIDGFTKVFWRDLPLASLWPQVGVLLALGIVLFILARRIARRWEFA